MITSKFSSDWKLAKAREFKSWEKKFIRTRILHEPSLRISAPFFKVSLPVYLPSRQILHNFDIIHAYSFATYSSLLGATLKGIKNPSLSYDQTYRQLDTLKQKMRHCTE